jgi:hypothetical protein
MANAEGLATGQSAILAANRPHPVFMASPEDATVASAWPGER